jgi:hypothetical protein
MRGLACFLLLGVASHSSAAPSVKVVADVITETYNHLVDRRDAGSGSGSAELGWWLKEGGTCVDPPAGYAADKICESAEGAEAGMFFPLFSDEHTWSKSLRGIFYFFGLM